MEIHVCSVMYDFRDSMDCSLPGSSVQVISQARILEWFDISSSRGSFWPRDKTPIPCLGTWFLFTTEAPGKPLCTFLFSLPSCVRLFVTPWIAARLPFLSLCPGVCSDSCTLSRWCYLTISSSAALFSFCLQSFPEAGSFPMSWLFASTGQSIRASTLASVLPMNNQGWFPLGLTGLISLYSKQLSRIFFSTTIWKHRFFGTQPSLWPSFHIRMWLLEKPYLWLCGHLLAKWCLYFLTHCLGLS